MSKWYTQAAIADSAHCHFTAVPKIPIGAMHIAMDVLITQWGSGWWQSGTTHCWRALLIRHTSTQHNSIWDSDTDRRLLLMFLLHATLVARLLPLQNSAASFSVLQQRGPCLACVLQGPWMLLLLKPFGLLVGHRFCRGAHIPATHY